MAHLYVLYALFLLLSPLMADAHWRLWTSETTGAGGLVSGDDWNEASSLNRLWDDVSLTTNAFTADGDGKYRITSCATSLQTINGTANGDVLVISIDGSGCTSLTIEDNTGNIQLPYNRTITLTSAEQHVLLIHKGSVLTPGYVGDPCPLVTASKSSDYTVGTDDDCEAFGGIVYVTSAATITAPAIIPGMSFVVVTIGAIAVSVDVNAADRMYLDGVALADGDKATNQSTSGDTLVCTYESSAGWYCASSSTTGTLWTDTN